MSRVTTFPTPTAGDCHVSLNPKDVRAWAIAESYTVATRGRVPVEVTTEYLYAHSAEARRLGDQLDLVVPVRGRVSYETCERIARSL